MSLMEPPQIDPSHFHRPDEELDRLLRGFFRAEVPTSWTAPQLPLAASLPLPVPTYSHPLAHSRYALAASVAILFGGQFLLNHFYQKDEAPGSGNSSSGVQLASPPHKKPNVSNRNRGPVFSKDGNLHSPSTAKK